MKYKDAEFTFEQQVAELHEVAAVASPAEQQQLTAPSVPSDSLVRLAAASPRAAIIEAWAEVASAAVSALRRRGVALPADISRRHLAIEQALQQSEILSPNQVALLRDLRQTRNTAAHAPKFALSEASALEYVMLATRMKALLDSKR